MPNPVPAEHRQGEYGHAEKGYREAGVAESAKEAFPGFPALAVSCSNP